jgi:hypothetical protein
MRRAALVLLAALSFAVSGCGGSSAEDALSETAAKLGDIRSGQLSLALEFQVRGAEPTGFMLDGPFSLENGPLVAGRLDYTQLLGSQGSQTATFISTGQKAYVVVRGQAYELPATGTAQLQAASQQLQAGGLASLDVGRWFEDPSMEDGGEVGGAETDVIHAHLNVLEVVNTLTQVSSQLRGTSAAPLSGEDAEQLRQATMSAEADIWTGQDDRLLRKLDLKIQFNPAGVPERIRQLIGVSVHFLVAVSDPNEEISVQAPANPLPASALGG